MYTRSNAFHAAYAAGNEQMAMLVFDDCLFTDDDIFIERGITLQDNFNMEEDLAIGQAVSNEIQFSLINEERLLNNYTFGDFQALIGVYLESATYTPGSGEKVRVVVGNNTYTGFATSPYVKKNGTAMAAQPSFAVKSMAVYDGKLYCFGANGAYYVYNEQTGANVTGSTTLNSFMTNKSGKWEGKGLYYRKTEKLLDVWESGEKRSWEFCPLGCFTAERPKAPDVLSIDLTCNDYMMKFDKDMSEISVTFPITIRNLFITLCTAVGVEYELPETFINGDAVITRRPDDFDSTNAREVLKWIAEASATNARFNRDGKLTLDWIRTGTGLVLGPGNYSEFTPYWYRTKKVTKLLNRDTMGGGEHAYGEGNETYLIQNNPLLRGVS